MFLDQSEQVWRKRAKVYDKLNWTTKKQYLSKIIMMCGLKSNYYVCDIGTGTGVVANEISKYCLKVDAIDSSMEMLDIAGKTHKQKNINYHLTNIEDVVYNKNQFDCVTARMCFHHIVNQHKAIQNCYDMLKTNGIFVISEGIPQPSSKKFYTEMFKLKEKRRTYTTDDLVELLEYGKFEDIEIIIHKMEGVSINNWLDNSGLGLSACERIFNAHLDAPNYVKESYNMV